MSDKSKKIIMIAVVVISVLCVIASVVVFSLYETGIIFKSTGSVSTTIAPTTLATTTLAPADPYATKNFLLKFNGDGNCIDGNGTTTYASACSTTNPYESYKFNNIASGLYSLQQVATNKCLDSNGNSLYYNNCDTTNKFQQWSPQTDGSIVQKATGQCLTGGAPWKLQNCGNTNQFWSITPSSI